MIIKSYIQNDAWSGRIRRRGIRRVARESGLDPAYVSKIVNNKIIVGKKTLLKLSVACNKLIPICQL